MNAKEYIFYLYENYSIVDKKLGSTTDKILNSFINRKICSAYQCFKDLNREYSKEGKSITYKNVHEPVQKLYSYNLVKKIANHTGNQTKKGAIYYTLTSFGIYYLIRNRRIWNLDFILEHNKNELFVLLLYPFIKFKTIKSLTDPEIIHAVCIYLIKCSQEIENWYLTYLKYVEESGGVKTALTTIESLLDPTLDDILYVGSKTFIEFLKSEFDIDWLDRDTSKISEVEKYKLLKISDPKHRQKELLLHLDVEKQEAILSEKNRETYRFILQKNRDQEYSLIRFWPCTVKESLENGLMNIENIYFSSNVNELFLRLIEYNTATPYYEEDEVTMHKNFKRLASDEHFKNHLKAFKEKFDSDYLVFMDRINQ